MADVFERQLELWLTAVQITANSLEILKERRGVSSNQIAMVSPWLLGIAEMIDTTINDYGVDAASDPSIEMGYRMKFSAYVRLEGSTTMSPRGSTPVLGKELGSTWETTSFARLARAPSSVTV